MKKMLYLVLLALFMEVQVKAAPEALDQLNINVNMMDSGPPTEEGNENANPQSRPGDMEHMESHPEPEPELNEDDTESKNMESHPEPEPNKEDMEPNKEHME